MEERWLADRQQLQHLLDTRPDWTRQDLADATGRSLGWVKKWTKRLRDTAPADPTILHSRSRARKTPPPRLSETVIARILEIRDQPPQNLGRIPGPKAILYYLGQDATTTLAGERLPRSTRSIWRILRQHQRILDEPRRTPAPPSRPNRSAPGNSTSKMPAPCPPKVRASSSTWSRRSTLLMRAPRSY